MYLSFCPLLSATQKRTRKSHHEQKNYAALVAQAHLLTVQPNFLLRSWTPSALSEYPKSYCKSISLKNTMLKLCHSRRICAKQFLCDGLLFERS